MKQYETSEVTVVNIGIPQMGFRSKTVHCVFSCFLMRFVHAVLLKSSTKKRRENTGKDPCIIFKSSTQSFQIIPKHWKKYEKIPKHCPCCSWIPAPWSRPFSIGSSAAVPLTTARSRSAPAAACPPQNCPRGARKLSQKLQKPAAWELEHRTRGFADMWYGLL